MQSEKAALTSGSTEKLNTRANRIDNKPKPQNYQLEISVSIRKSLEASYNRFNFCCDECSLPLRFYGENFIETYTNGRANVLRCLCDLHAAEMEVNA